MERVRVPALICLLFSLLLSISKGKTQLHFSSYNFIIVAKPSFVTLFFMFHFIIIAIFVGRPKPSVEDLEDSFSYIPPPPVSFSSIPPPSVYEMDETIKEVEVCDSTGTEDEEDDQNYSTFDGYDDIQEFTDDEEEVSDGYVEDNEDDGVSDHPKGDQDYEDEEYDNELEKKIEGFIEKVYQERREEFLRDRFLCITAG
ncbi:hypothetical protein SADUNF_Sadunf14G0045200 [Salix dunnii]|uniref:Uncharacterized protein n=1 Tax=Salix dunnii TaxID=1413687 RepID=A0A835MK87_9ROSI|nr:hypothetical protein SADUNF_Sadunf14G0045200 [Salix dunnii]